MIDKREKKFLLFLRRKKSDKKKGKSLIKNRENSLIKTVIFFCFEKVLIRNSSRKLYDASSEEAQFYSTISDGT